MKIKDILNESIEDMYNPEAAKIADENREYYKEYFKNFFQFGDTPVFTEQTNFDDPNAEEWDTKPDRDKRQSAGYRGQQNALVKAGVPHDANVQKYEPGAFTYTSPE